MLKDSSGDFHLSNESFWRFVWDNNNEVWTAWDRAGNKYEFNYQTHYAKFRMKKNGCEKIEKIWRWDLSRITNIYGESLEFDHVNESKLFRNPYPGCEKKLEADISVYLDTITYPHGRYRVVFLRESRNDYHDGWESIDSRVLYMKSRLDEIRVEQDADGDQVFEQVIRKYDFTYASSQLDHIFPYYDWSEEAGNGYYTTTLLGVQEYGLGGTSALPATTLIYEDGMHLTRAENGYGGKVEFDYEEWHDIDNNDNRLYEWDSSTGRCRTKASGSDPWQGNFHRYSDGGRVKCFKNGQGVYNGIEIIDEASRKGQNGGRPPRPGHSWFLVEAHLNDHTSDYDAKIGVGYGPDAPDSVTTEWYTDNPDLLTITEFLDMNLSEEASEFRMFVHCDDNCRIGNFKIKVLPMYYRVVQKRIYDGLSGSSPEIFTYRYDEPATNDADHSEEVATGQNDWHEDYEQFRGHSIAEVENPDGLVTTTFFHQDDDLSGYGYRILSSDQEYAEDFEDFSVTGTTEWTLTGAGTEHLTERLFGDIALESVNADADWDVTASRSTAALSDGDFMLAQFQVSSVDTAAELGLLEAGGGDFFGIQADGTNGIVERYDTGSGLTTGSTLVTSTDFELDEWYVLMILVDDGDDFWLRVWQKNDPGMYGSVTRGDLSGSANWGFRLRTNNGTSWLDAYREGVLYLESESTYATEIIPAENPEDWQYDDLVVRWNYMTESIDRSYEGDAAWTGTRSTYTYYWDGDDPLYGNLEALEEAGSSGGSWTNYRATKNIFNSAVVDSSHYLVSLPQSIAQYACPGGTCDYESGDRLTEDLYLYDGNASPTGGLDDGILTGDRHWATGSAYTQVSYGYDTYGNVTTATTYENYAGYSSNPSGDTFTETTTYDSTYHTYPTQVTNAESLITSFTYNYALGLPVTMTDSNGIESGADYDAFGRFTELCRLDECDGGSEITVFTVDYHDAASPFWIELTQRINSTQSTVVRRYYDGLGRQVQNKLGSADVDTGASVVTRDIVVDYDYDFAGQLVKESVPYITSTADTGWLGQDFTTVTETEYDLLGRTDSVQPPNDNYISYAYDDLEVTVTDPRGKATTTSYDVWGRATTVDAPAGPDLSYTYDVLGNMLTATKGSGGSATTITITYDHLGRKTSLDDPDMGDWDYTYFPDGNLMTQTDARGCTATLAYDDIRRLTGKAYSGTPDECDDTPDASYTYDDTSGGNYGAGHRTGMSDGSGSTAWVYDSRGRLIEENRTITGQGAFVTQWTYNNADLPVTMEYPDGETLEYTYDDHGALIALQNDEGSPFIYVDDINYDVARRMTELILGDGILERAYGYDSWGTDTTGGLLASLSAVQLGGSQETLLDLDYDYDRAANITEIDDLLNDETSAFAYDDLNRITSMDVVDDQQVTIHSEVFQYASGTGNLWKVGADTESLLEYFYEGDQPHAVTHVGNSNSPQAYWYDDNGNMSERIIAGGQNIDLTYDAENRLISVAAVPDEIFSDGFESADLSAWDSSATDGGDLSASAAAALCGDYGMQAVIDDTNNLYVLDDTPDREPRYRARFYFDPNSITMADGDSHYLLALRDASENIAYVDFAYSSGNYRVRGMIRDDSSSWSNTSFYTITDDVHFIEIDWAASTEPGADDGYLSLWVDGSLSETITDVDNDTRRAEQARLGAPFAIDASTSGTEHFDSFVSGRYSEIGEEEGCGGRSAPEGGSTETATATATMEEKTQPTETPAATPEPTYTATTKPTGIPEASATVTQTQSATPLQTQASTQTLGSSSTSSAAAAAPEELPTETAVDAQPLQQETSVPIDTPEDTGTPALTLTSSPQDTPQPSETPEPTATPTPSPSSSPEETPTPTGTAESSATPTATLPPTEMPSETDMPTVSATPTQTASATSTPAPTEVVAPPDEESRSGSMLLGGAVSELESAAYSYDGDGNLVKSVIDGVTTLYIGDHYQEVIDGIDTTVVKYYFAAAMRIAVRTQVNEDPSTLYWILGDHLGSTAVTASADGTFYGEIRYTAFGEARYSSGTTPTDYRYTGQRLEEVMGIYYYRARWYDPALGRFMQADTIVPEPGSSLALDRYAYANNNPLRYTDPSGNVPCKSMGGEGDCIFDPAKYRRPPILKQQFLSNLPPFYDPQADVYGVISAGYTIGRLPYSSGESLPDEEQMANFRYRIDPGQAINVYGGGLAGAAPLGADLLNMLLEDLANAAYLESLEQNVHVDIYYCIYWGQGYRIPGAHIKNESDAVLLLDPLMIKDVSGNQYGLALGQYDTFLNLVPIGPPSISPGEEATICIESPVDYFQPGLYLDIGLRIRSLDYPMPIASSWRIWEYGTVNSYR